MVPRTGSIKPTEDKIDAVLCAYIGAHWWLVGTPGGLGCTATKEIDISLRLTPAPPIERDVSMEL
jgi:hypothetical protein